MVQVRDTGWEQWGSKVTSNPTRHVQWVDPASLRGFMEQHEILTF